MGQRRSASIRALGPLWAHTSSRLHTTVTAGAVLSAIGKVLPVFVAWRIAGGDARGAAIVGGVGLGVLGVSRVVSSGVRVNAECDLHRAVTRALLDGDVLTSPTSQPVRALFEPLFNARTLLTETMPELAASLLAALLVAPIVATTLPARALVVSAIAIFVIMVVLAWLSRISSTLQARIWREQEQVLDRVGFTIESRLELVARGGEGAALSALDGAIERYRSVARRGAWGAALLGRAPLAAGLVVVVVIVLLDTSYREAVTATVLAQALVLAACLPIGLGVVTRISELLRSAARVAPLLDVLASPARPELARAGSPPPALPATITAQDVTFAYAPDVEPTLRRLSFSWEPGTLLIIEGPNGAGKSTLLRLVLGLRAPQSGSLTVGDRELGALDLRAFRKGIAYLPQRPYLGEAQSTVRSALQLLGDESADDVLMSVLARVGLGAALAARAVSALDVVIGELSAGQRQRVALARVLLCDARVYLLDEPDANLDRDGIRLVGELVGELVQRGRMIAIAAHTTELTSLAGTRVTLE